MRKEIFEALNGGVWMYAGARDLPEASEALTACADLCHRFNNMLPSMRKERMELLHRLLGGIGEGSVINAPFHCDFGFNIRIGRNFVGNFNLTILDEADVTIGDNVLIGPGSSLITIIHALLPGQRAEGIMRAQPIVIRDNAWLAANVTVLPGVTVGEGAVIGAGSVVTRSIPAMTLAVGNPCRPLRTVSDADRVTPMDFREK